MRSRTCDAAARERYQIRTQPGRKNKSAGSRMSGHASDCAQHCAPTDAVACRIHRAHTQEHGACRCCMGLLLAVVVCSRAPPPSFPSSPRRFFAAPACARILTAAPPCRSWGTTTTLAARFARSSIRRPIQPSYFLVQTKETAVSTFRSLGLRDMFEDSAIGFSNSIELRSVPDLLSRSFPAP